MTLQETKYVVVYRMSPDNEQEEREFNTKVAAQDYLNTVQLLGGVAIILTITKPIGDML